MANLEDLVSYLSRGECLVWVGAGPSIGMEVPSWQKLAAGLLEKCRRQQKPIFQTLEDQYRTARYDRLFGEVSRSYSEAFLNDYFMESLQDPGTDGDLYDALLEIPFRSYFTTNVDGILVRIARQKGAIQYFLNGESDLATVEHDVVPCVVALHGDLADPQSLIMTDQQYRIGYEHGSKEYFQQFLKTHLSHDRILFVGYSMRDPELLALQRRLSANLRRVVPAFAIIANATSDDISRFSDEYNIAVLTYNSADGNHSRLGEILRTANRFLASKNQPSPSAPTKTLGCSSGSICGTGLRSWLTEVPKLTR